MLKGYGNLNTRRLHNVSINIYFSSHSIAKHFAAGINIFPISYLAFSLQTHTSTHVITPSWNTTDWLTLIGFRAIYLWLGQWVPILPIHMNNPNLLADVPRLLFPFSNRLLSNSLCSSSSSNDIGISYCVIAAAKSSCCWCCRSTGSLDSCSWWWWSISGDLLFKVVVAAPVIRYAMFIISRIERCLLLFFNSDPIVIHDFAFASFRCLLCVCACRILVCWENFGTS